MKQKLTKFCIAAAALSLPLGAPAIADEQTELTKGEIELAEILDGYVAGEPVRCLSSIRTDRLMVVDRTALVFRDGATIYVNRTSTPDAIDDFDIPVFKQFTSSLCRKDTVEFIDRFGGIPGPFAFLEDFVPYTKVESET